jgi:hypothetical protein
MPRSQNNRPREDAAFAALLDGLRALAAGTRAPVVVLAEVCGEGLMDRLTGGLAELAKARGVRIRWAGLGMVDGRRLVRLEDEAAARGELDLGASPPSEQVRAWLAAAGVAHDLVLVAAPPLDRSLDGALLACESDGLVLLAENGGLSTDQLSAGVERAKATGCTLLGLALLGHREWLPRWLAKLVSRYPRALAPARPARPKPLR